MKKNQHEIGIDISHDTGVVMGRHSRPTPRNPEPVLLHQAEPFRVLEAFPVEWPAAAPAATRAVPP